MDFSWLSNDTFWKGVSTVSSGLQLYSTFRSADQIQGQGQSNAALAELEAQQAELSAADRERIRQDEINRTLGIQRAGFGASGVDPNTGTPLLVYSDTLKKGMEDIEAIREQGRLQAWSARLSGQNSVQYANQLSSATKTEGITRILGNAKTIYDLGSKAFGSDSAVATAAKKAVSFFSAGTAASGGGAALASFAASGGGAVGTGMLPVVGAGSQYAGMFATMDALAAGQGITTGATVAASAAAPSTAAASTTTGTTIASTTAGSISMLGALGITGAIIGIGKLLSSLSGGASDRNKVSEAAAWFQKSPEAGFQNLDNIINNVKWSNESSNIGVITGMVDAGVINVAYPTLHSANSILDVWSGTNRLNPAKTLSYGYSGNTNPLSPKLEAQTYGMNEAQQNQYADLHKTIRELEDRISGEDDNPGRRNQPLFMQLDSAKKQLEQMRSQYMTEDRKRATARKIYTDLRAAGYTGDLSKIESYLGMR